MSGEVADSVCKKLGMDHWGRSETVGISERNWALWNKADIWVFIKILQWHQRAAKSTQLTTVYASPNASRRRELWEKLDEMAILGAWALIGDFNCVLTPEEKSSNSSVSSSFVEWVDRRNLIDHGYSGPHYTRNHGGAL